MVIFEGKTGHVEKMNKKLVDCDWEPFITAIIDTKCYEWKTRVDVYRLNTSNIEEIQDYIMRQDSRFFLKHKRIVIVGDFTHEDILKFQEFEDKLRADYTTKELVVTIRNDDLDHIKIVKFNTSIKKEEK